MICFKRFYAKVRIGILEILEVDKKQYYWFLCDVK